MVFLQKEDTSAFNSNYCTLVFSQKYFTAFILNKTDFFIAPYFSVEHNNYCNNLAPVPWFVIAVLLYFCTISANVNKVKKGNNILYFYENILKS